MLYVCRPDTDASPHLPVRRQPPSLPQLPGGLAGWLRDEDYVQALAYDRARTLDELELWLYVSTFAEGLGVVADGTYVDLDLARTVLRLANSLAGPAVPLWLVGLDVRDASVALRWYARAVRAAAP